VVVKLHNIFLFFFLAPGVGVGGGRHLALTPVLTGARQGLQVSVRF
jgi:hypothetical protein